MSNRDSVCDTAVYARADVMNDGMRCSTATVPTTRTPRTSTARSWHIISHVRRVPVESRYWSARRCSVVMSTSRPVVAVKRRLRGVQSSCNRIGCAAHVPTASTALLPMRTLPHPASCCPQPWILSRHVRCMCRSAALLEELYAARWADVCRTGALSVASPLTLPLA